MQKKSRPFGRPDAGIQLFFVAAGALALEVAAIVTLSGVQLLAVLDSAAPVRLALEQMALMHLLRSTALRAGIYALPVTMLAIVGAARRSAVAAPVVIVLHVLLALHGIDARAVVRIIARGLVTAEGIVAPQLTAHAARGMGIGVAAGILVAAAAHRRIAEVHRLVRLTGHVLRNSAAVLADRLVQVRAHLAGKVTVDAAGSQIMVAVVTGIVTGIAAGSRGVTVAVAHAVTDLAALRTGVIHAVAVIVAALAARTAGMIRAVTVAVAGLEAVGSIMIHAVAAEMTRNTAVRSSVLHAVAHAVTRGTAGRSRMLLIIAVHMARNAAGSRGMILAIAVDMILIAASRKLMIPAITMGMALDPAGLRAVMVHAIAAEVTRLAAVGRALLVRHCAERKHQTQQQTQKHQHRLLHMDKPPHTSAGNIYSGSIFTVFIISHLYFKVNEL